MVRLGFRQVLGCFLTMSTTFSILTLRFPCRRVKTATPVSTLLINEVRRELERFLTRKSCDAACRMNFSYCTL
jgi:hypothetical protein